MAGWSDLSVDLKKNVVEKLDLMGRQSLRCTSHADRSIVDDTDFHISRVRLSISKSGYLIVVHTRIDDWLRVEILNRPNGGAIINKSQNSWNPEDVVTKELEEGTPEFWTILLLHNFFDYGTTKIDAVEFEIEGGTDAPKGKEVETLEKTITEIQEFIKKCRKFRKKTFIFRAKTLVGNWNMTVQMDLVWAQLMDFDTFKSVERLSVSIHSDSLKPFVCCDTVLPKIDVVGWKISHVTSTLHHTYKNPWKEGFYYLGVVSDGFSKLRFSKFDEKAQEMWDAAEGGMRQISPTIIEKREYGRCMGKPITVIHHRSDCGYWAFVVPYDKEKDFKLYYDSFMKENRENGTCGLSWLCKTCTNDFDYNYYQNLAHRGFLEPNWNGVLVKCTCSSTCATCDSVKLAKIEYSKKLGNLKIQKNENQKSWGFGKNSEGPEEVKIPKNVIFWRKIGANSESEKSADLQKLVNSLKNIGI
ncbi:hypothetical protein B9Z55_027053 [Caenorhabditis nigoni]|uniref:F-box domain-containing protein n=1 Tax=Caenorhabditis nigoni TaxID=1611254 RepID=A0A2G5SJ26_9PELO|nr:hypothetical protein B9Z55_027053 [Caenorhabditis nigoni]